MAKLRATSVDGNLTVTGKVTSTVAGATTSTIGTVKLNDATNDTSTTTAATANAVKKAYDKGNHSHPYAPTSHGNHVPTTQTASNSVFLRNDNTWQTVRPDSIGAMKGSSIEGTTGATAGWYRIAQSAVDINNNTGIFMIRAAASGKHSSTTLSAGVTYGQNPIIQQISHTQYSGTGISKARVVYHATYSGNRAYLEVYIPDATTRPIIVQLIGALGWSLLSPSTAGSVPSGYTNKEITLATGKIVSDINGTVNGYSIAKSVPSDAKFTDTNTWRPVVDNLTSTATDQSLSAAQGKVLKGLVDDKANSSHGTHVSYGTGTTSSSYGGAAAAGTASTVSRSDHKHALPALPTASTSASGIVKLNSATNSVSTTEAATASAVKKAYDKGNHSHPYLSTSGGTVSGSLSVSQDIKTSLIKNPDGLSLINDTATSVKVGNGSKVLVLNSANDVYIEGGNYGESKIYHEYNKPTAKSIGAMEQAHLTDCDLNDYHGSSGTYGVYKFKNGPLGATSADGRIATLEVSRYSNDWVIQKLTYLAERYVYTRRRHSGTTWSSWEEGLINFGPQVYRNDFGINIGLKSGTDGFARIQKSKTANDVLFGMAEASNTDIKAPYLRIGPSGMSFNGNYVVQSGSNTNGDYIKFYDGTMICHKVVEIGKINFEGAWGSLWGSGYKALGNWAATFVKHPKASLQMTTDSASCWPGAIKGDTATTAGSIELYRGTKALPAGHFWAHLTAIGKWK